MKRIGLLLLVLIILLVVCIWLQPTLSGVDFLTLDVTVFSIAVALMTFTAPTLMKFRDKLLDLDLTILKANKEKLELLRTLSETNEQVNKGINTYSEKIKRPFQISDSITKYFEGTKNVMVWCLVAVFIHIVFNEILLTSNTFIQFVKEDMYCITGGWNLPVIKSIVTSYIKLGSLALQLFFLFRTSEDAISIIQIFKAE